MNVPGEPWCMGAVAALADLQSRAQGLTAADAQQRLAKVGPNRLPETPPRPTWLKFIDQFKNLLVLIGTAALAGAIGDTKDAVVILVVIVLNAGLGLYQEHRARATLAALKQMLARHARVRRDDAVLQVDAEALVPGDIVLLEAGDRVPADARVLVAHNAEVAEAALTGESHAVAKHAGLLAPGDHALAGRLNMVFMNTVVTRGRIEAVACTTGMHTEMGRISGLLDAAPEQPTPLQIQIDALGKSLAGTAGAVVTVTLAIGMHRMARDRAIVEKLSAVATLGSTTVICCDKTGTLTLNQMTARAVFFRRRHFTVSGEGYADAGTISAQDGLPLPDFQALMVPAVLCHDSSIRDA